MATCLYRRGVLAFGRSHRGRLRLIRHYVPFGLASLAFTAALAAWVDSPVLFYRLSLATAFTGLILFGLSLAIGPFGLLTTGRLLPVSSDLRRDVGILAAFFSVAHVAFGLFVYTDIRLYFLYPVSEWPRTDFPLRLDDLGTANWTGLAATILIVVLLATSGDWALRRYGARRWKGLQQLTYWAFALVFVHGQLYQRMEPRDEHSLVLIFGLVVGSVLFVQLAGALKVSQIVERRRSLDRRTDRSLDLH